MFSNIKIDPKLTNFLTSPVAACPRSHMGCLIRNTKLLSSIVTDRDHRRTSFRPWSPGPPLPEISGKSRQTRPGFHHLSNHWAFRAAGPWSEVHTSRGDSTVSEESSSRFSKSISLELDIKHSIRKPDSVSSSHPFYQPTTHRLKWRCLSLRHLWWPLQSASSLHSSWAAGTVPGNPISPPDPPS